MANAWTPLAAAQRATERSLERLDSALGGRARRHVIVLLAGVLGLASADQATVGASATQLRAALDLNHAELGLVAAVSGLVGAVATVPFGALVDRTNRTRLLAIGVAGWALVMVASATASSYPQLVLTRCALGAVVAVATPAAASLIGDCFDPAERGQIWGYVLTGELVGAGFGFTVAGGLASISWRVSFAVLAVPAVALAVLLWRLPEPARGGSGRLPVDGEEAGETDGDVMSAAQRAAALGPVRPHDDLVLDPEEAEDMPLRRAVGHVLRIRTNVILIVAGAVGYFFFAGARAFGVEFVKGQYGVGQGMASALALVLGVFAVAGVLASGVVSDRLGARGRLSARITIGAVALGGATVFFLPALLVGSLGLGILTLGTAALCLAAVNPPLDAGRLDIMPPPLWGRAEAVRTLVREPAEATAPLLFGLLADHLAGGGHSGLQAAFLVMLVPLALSVVVLLPARRSYPGDVATAAATIERSRQRRPR